MKSDNDKAVPQEQEHFTVSSFRPEDADGIVDLFRDVYGEGYPIRLFYDPAAITAANREGRYYSICARTTSGKVVGVTHLYLSAPFKSMYEWGAGLVLKECRNWGINNRLGDFVCNEFVPRNPHIEELFGEAVCNHPYMQKAIARFNIVETAIEVALMPAEAYTREKSAAGRVATLNGFRCYKPKPHRIFLPPAYELELRGIYARLDDAREIVLSEAQIPAGGTSRAELEVFDFARVARIAVPQTEGDFSGHESFAAAGRFVIEKNAGNREHPITFTIILRNKMGVNLRAAVRRAGIERRSFLLRNLQSLAEHFA